MGAGFSRIMIMFTLMLGFVALNLKGYVVFFVVLALVMAYVGTYQTKSRIKGIVIASIVVEGGVLALAWSNKFFSSPPGTLWVLTWLMVPVLGAIAGAFLAPHKRATATPDREKVATD